MARKVIKFVSIVLALSMILLIFTGCDNLKLAENVINIKDYGTKGNGKEDDSLAIQKALTEVREGENAGATIVFPEGRYYVKEEALNFSYDMAVRFNEGAVLVIDADARVSFNNETIDAGRYQIFELMEDATINGLSKIRNIYPEWFGAVANDGKDDSDALAKLFSCTGLANFGEGTYNIDKTVPVKKASASTGIDIKGAGKDKTTILIGSGITAFDAYDNISNTQFNLNDVTLKGTDKTSHGIKTMGGAASAKNCHFEGLNVGIYMENAGFTQMVDNTATDNNTVYDIGPLSMFLYFDGCTGDRNGRFINCIVPPSGGISNGIVIQDCHTTNGTGIDLYLTENQAVWIVDSSFEGGTGGEAALYFEKLTDWGITDSVISSASSGRMGIYAENSAYGQLENLEISGCSTGISLRSSSSTVIKANKFSGNTERDVYLRNSQRNSIVNNDFASGLAKAVVGEVNNSKVSITDNVFNSAEYDISASFGDRSSDLIVKRNTFNG